MHLNIPLLPWPVKAAGDATEESSWCRDVLLMWSHDRVPRISLRKRAGTSSFSVITDGWQGSTHCRKATPSTTFTNSKFNQWVQSDELKLAAFSLWGFCCISRHWCSTCNSGSPCCAIRRSSDVRPSTQLAPTRKVSSSVLRGISGPGFGFPGAVTSVSVAPSSLLPYSQLLWPGCLSPPGGKCARGEPHHRHAHWSHSTPDGVGCSSSIRHMAELPEKPCRRHSCPGHMTVGNGRLHSHACCQLDEWCGSWTDICIPSTGQAASVALRSSTTMQGNRDHCRWQTPSQAGNVATHIGRPQWQGGPFRSHSPLCPASAAAQPQHQCRKHRCLG